jgi:hypothetical protein
MPTLLAFWRSPVDDIPLTVAAISVHVKIRRSLSHLESASTFQGATEREFVCVFQIPSNRQAAGQP